MTRSFDEAGWRFDNTYARLPEPLHAPAVPVAVRSPAVMVLNEPLAAELGLEVEALRNDAGVFVGTTLPPGG